MVIFSPYLPRLIVIDLRHSEESQAIIRGLDVRDIFPEDLRQEINSYARNGEEILVPQMKKILATVRKFLDGERPELSRVFPPGAYVHSNPESFFSEGWR